MGLGFKIHSKAKIHSVWKLILNNIACFKPIKYIAPEVNLQMRSYSYKKGVDISDGLCVRKVALWEKDEQKSQRLFEFHFLKNSTVECSHILQV